MAKTREITMRLKDWEATLQQIVTEFTQTQTETLQRRILKDWRVRLENAPHLLEPYQIDMLVREVRRRLGNAGP